MKLWIIGPHPVRNNGMSQYIEQYKNELTRRGHEVVTERMYFWREKWQNGRWLSLRSRLQEGFDAVIIQHTPTASGPMVIPFLSTARRAKVRTVVVGHEPPSIYSKHLPKALRFLYHAYERAVFSRAALRIVHTDLHADELRAIGVTSPITVIPIPVYGPKPLSVSPEERKTWGYYGMISPKKGLDLLLAAYQAKPPGYYPPLRILGGPAPGNEAYVKTLEAGIRPGYSEWISFSGYVEEERLPEEFSRIAMMIFPYRWVSQSAALAQTCLHRIPYLAADLSYFADFQRRHGCGGVFQGGSTQALAQALEEAKLRPATAGDFSFDALIEALSLPHCVDRLLEAISSAPAAT